MKKLNTILTAIILFAILSCGETSADKTLSDSDAVFEDTESLQIEYNPDSSPAPGQITLPSSGTNGTSISWKSSDTAIISNEGKVTPPVFRSGEAIVTLTAEITKGYALKTKDFIITVKESEPTVEEALYADLEFLEIIYTAPDNNTSVTSDISLPLCGKYKTPITWESDKESVISAEGKVFRPLYGSGDSEVIISAALSAANISKTKQFALTVKEMSPVPVESIKLNRDTVKIQLSETFQLLAEINPENATNRNVIWTSDNSAAAVVSGTGMVSPAGKGTAVITASSEDGGLTATCTVKVTDTYVMPENPGDIIISEFMANPKSVSDTDGEWIELYNTTDSNILLDGLVISRGTQSYSLSGTDLLIYAKSYFLISRKEASIANLPFVDAVIPISLANTGSHNLLIKTGSLILDEVSYSVNAADGKSFQLCGGKLNHTDNNLWENWCEGTDNINESNSDKGTPGRANNECQ